MATHIHELTQNCD
jgi:hypothetical protein